jgi:soluble lytic murein transglycosylase-like protein
MIASAAARHRVDPLLLHSVILQESRYRPQAVSRAGARGLMQVMPATGAGLGVTNAAMLMDPATNIEAGTRLLRRLWDRMGGRMDLALAAYNAGEGNVRRYGMQVPPYLETRGYVANVQAIYRKLAAGTGLLRTN